MSKKILSLLLALTLIFSVLPISAFASEAESPSTEIIETIETTDGDGETTATPATTAAPMAGTPRVSENRTLYYKNVMGFGSLNIGTDENSVMLYQDQSGKWSASGNTLTLKDGFNFTTTGVNALVVPDGTIIVLEGSSTISVESSSLSAVIYGITVSGNLTIKGSGALTVSSNNTHTNGTATGIYANNLTIEDGTVEASATVGGSATANGIGGNLTITGGTVTATGKTRAFDRDYTVPSGYTYWVNDTPSAGGTETVSTGDTTNDKIDSTYKYAKIEAAGESRTLYYNPTDSKIHQDSYTGDVVTTADVPGWSGNGTTLTLNGIDFETSATYALYVPDGTTITVTGNNTLKTTYSSGASYAVFGFGALTINGTGSLNAVTTAATGSCSAIATNAGALTVEGSVQINANSNGAYGVYAYSFNMTGGTIYAKGATIAMLALGTVPADVVVKGKSGSDYTVDGKFTLMPGEQPVSVTTTADGTTNLTDAKIALLDSNDSDGDDEDVGGNNSNTSSSSSSGISSSRPEPPKPVIAPLNDKSSGTLNTAIDSAASTASSDGKNLDVKLKNVSSFTKANAAAIIAKAKSLGKPATVSSDIMSEDGRYVEVRVTLDPALIAKTVRLDGYTRESQTIVTQSRFIKHFENKTAVISLGQEGKFGQTAKISAKLDLKGFDSANLFLYNYDKKANKYTLITNKDYKIDKNGYLVFNTDLGGDIIVSNGRLEKKQ